MPNDWRRTERGVTPGKSVCRLMNLNFYAFIPGRMQAFHNQTFFEHKFMKTASYIFLSAAVFASAGCTPVPKTNTETTTANVSVSV